MIARVLASVCVAFALAPVSAFAGVEIPSRFDHNGVYVRLTTAGGRTFELYTDTGGGGLLLSRAAAQRLGLAVVPVQDPELKAELGPDAAMAPSPALAPPLPPLPPRAMITPRAAQLPAFPEQADGFLGAAWFAGRVWTWDYVRHRLVLEDASFVPPAGARRLPLGFQTGADGTRTTDFARMAIEVDGATIDVLLDTGAETLLKPKAEAVLGTGGMRATSMMAAKVFESWRRAHPEWRYIPDAQAASGAAMIEAPHVRIAGIDVGPVWFTERPDANYDRFMSSMMDKPVQGSIGGNAFRGLSMTIDYPKAEAWFRCEAGCRR